MPPADAERAAGTGWELAEIFREHGERYRRTHVVPAAQLTVMRAIENCRTAELGGHLERCTACGFERPAYNSCRNRHCPKCQGLATARWLKQRQAELLPVGYFHLVFTLPHHLNPLVLAHTRLLLNFLFKAVSETLLDFARTHLDGLPGFLAVLHTWDQTLNAHFHLHCLIPAGALSVDQRRWIPARPTFLFPVKALSRVFRGKFLALLQRAVAQGRLPRAEPLDGGLTSLRQTPWVVYAEPPFGSPAKVLDYLGRYTHRVALSNDRILALHDGQVTFRYRDRRDGDRPKAMTLEAQEFIRRFLLHVLPKGLMRIRHFGFLANRTKAQALPRCRVLLGLAPALPKPPRQSTQELLLELTGLDLARCPACPQGTMVVVAELPRTLPPWDSS